MKEGDEIVFRCYAIGTPNVDYSWFRNDGILLESSRIVVSILYAFKSLNSLNFNILSPT